jgi:Pentapeptide repeats (8 copies)
MLRLSACGFITRENRSGGSCQKVRAGRTCSPNVLHVLKHWASWPRGIRWLEGIAAVVLGLAIAWALFVPAADWLAHHDVGSATGALHETALDNARGRLLTLAAGVFAAGALVFTARNFTLSREGQVTDRYTKAIEQLGSDKLDVRVGGIYALERVARDSARDHPIVVEVLSAFVREHSREPWPRPSDDESGAGPPERTTRPDVEAAVTVIGRRNFRYDRERVLLGGTSTNLPRLTLTNAWLAGADLTSADLTRAFLSGTTFTGAWLPNTNLTGARLDGADLTDAWLSRANLTDASLIGAILTGADLTGADLTGADLTGANLDSATWPEGAPVPEGWKRDTNSGRMKAARSDTETAEAS